MAPQAMTPDTRNEARQQQKLADPYLSNDFFPLNQAHNTVIAALRAEEASTDADLYRRIASDSASGTDEGRGHLYRSLEKDGTNGASPRGEKEGATAVGAGGTASVTCDVHPTLAHSQSIPLPNYITKVLKEAKLSSLMGILPEANMVWVSVDDTLYLWEYQRESVGGVGKTSNSNADDFVCFKVPSGQCVVSVGLVKPKLGVFKDVVEWCLVVTTPEEAILCALARETTTNASSFQETSTFDSLLRLIPTRYVIPTDAVPLLSICGSESGRIFMGGYDGSLYEMSYEGFFSPNQRQGDWYEDYGSDLNGNTHSRTSMTSALAAGSKRVISTLVFGPSTPNQRPRKCRKINHTTVAPPLVESFVPGFVLRTASALFSTSSTVNGGPIVNLSMDTDRDTLYALTSKGYIHAFDLNGIGANAQLTEGVAKSAPPPRLACSMNVVKSVRKYLDSVARGRMYPPMASADATVANIRFPGGGTGAQAGVGGMDGARSLLKVADTETMRVNTKKKNARGSPDDSVFSPMSIHVVPLSESSCLTLVAILAGGLRLYLSVLPDAGTRKSGVSVRPGRNFTLCHVRAPPPFNVHGKKLTLKNKEVLSNGFAPGVGSASLNSRKGCYSSSATIMAIGCGNQAASSDKSSDTIVALTPDYCYRSERSEGVNSKASNFSLATYNESDGSGISEMISLPMAKQSASGDGDSFVPGGHIWDIVSVSHYSTSSVSSSFFLSSTPHDSELCEDVIPAFVHSSKKIRSGFNRANYVAGKSNSSDPFADVQRGSLLSMTLDAVGNVMFGRPKRTGRVNSAISNLPRQPMYRILDHARCKNVFSISQNLNSRQSRYSRRTNDTSQPHRLPSWLLSPAKIPLPELSSQHLGKDVLTKRFIALNSGGLHIFTHISPLEKLRDVLLKSNTSNIARDQNVKSFFVSYGHREACSMCLAVAINIDSEAVARKAMQAALSFSNRPSMYHTLGNGSNNLVTSSTLEDCTIDHPYGHEGYSFKPSSLHDGLVVLISRILRPVWCKAPVVVREGKGTKSKHSTGQERKPALVELFLDDSTSDDIRKPLIRLQVLMREMFPPAISVIPGAPSSDSDAMEITETIGEGSLLTRAIQYQTQASTSTHAHSEKELRSIAHLSEERSLHSLYRLVSRSAQLLSLLSHLRRAHVTPELPEVDFGLLHGLTFSQLVTTRIAQDRIEAIFTDLFSNHEAVASMAGLNVDGNMNVSVESKNLSSNLSQDCYLYFSVGSRLTYLGFRAAYEALSRPQPSDVRLDRTRAASLYLRDAASHWYNPSHVTGLSFNNRSSLDMGMGCDSIANLALEYGSPVARAASVLMELNDVSGVVDVCLISASNFSELSFQTNVDSSLVFDESMMPWEKELYHRPVTNNTNLDPSDVGSSQLADTTSSRADSTSTNARDTCYAILFHHLGKLILSCSEFPQNNALKERMISVASSSSSSTFLHALYAFLLESGNTDTLLRIENSDLKNWLKDSRKDYHLLWRYYVVHGIDWMAGEIMWNHSCSKESIVSLDERIESLTRAINSYSAALKNFSTNTKSFPITFMSPQSNKLEEEPKSPSREEIDRIMRQISEQIDVAKLQSRTLSTIQASGDKSNIDQDRLLKLSHTLLNVSTLYNEYAAPFGLYDLCLLIMQTCRYDDDETITTLWKSIICEELLPCRTSNKGVEQYLTRLQRGSMLEEVDIVLSDTDVTCEQGVPLKVFEDGKWIPSLKNRVVSLGKELNDRGVDYAFPLEFIAECLEGLQRIYRLSTSRPSQSWPLQTLFEGGTKFLPLMEAYNNLFMLQTNEAGSDPKMKLSQLSSLSEILIQWISSAYSNPSGVGGDNKESNKIELIRYSESILTQIDSYKEALESLVGCHPDEVSNVYAALSNVEETLRRNTLN